MKSIVQTRTLIYASPTPLQNTMELNKCKKKFKLLFDKFLEDNFELCHYYSENLLKHLEDSDDECAGKILDTPFFSDLILYSLRDIEKMTTSVKIFVFKVFATAIRNELQFSKMEQQQGFKMIIEKIIIKFPDVPPTRLHVAGLKTLTAHTLHYSGIMRLIQFKVWTRVLRFNVYKAANIAKQTTNNLLSKLVWKLNEYDEEAALIEVLEYIVNPIKTCQYLNLESIDTENEKVLYEPILPYISAIVAIIKTYENKSGQNKVLHLLTRHFMVMVPIHFILEKTRSFEMVCLISEFNFYFILAMCKDFLSDDTKGSRDIATELISGYHNFVSCLVNKRMTSAVTYYAVKCILIWAKIDVSPFPTTFERNERTFNLQNQFIALVLTPLLTYTTITSTARNDRTLLEAVDVHCLKFSKMNCEPIIKAAYSFRTLLESSDGKKAVIFCLREIFKLKGCLNLVQAGMLYEALYYVLKLHIISDGSGALILNENPLTTPDDVKLLSLVLEAIRMLLMEHDINWYENVEIISLQTTLMDLLKHNFVPTKQLLQAIDLIDVCIKKFLSPDMALLMESKRGSTLNEIGAMIRSYVAHEEWEVRDSALQLLLSCTEVAFVEYLPLRKLVSENNLIILAAHAAVEDSEFYVQATALKCLAATTKIESLWMEVLIAQPNLYVQLVDILQRNSEGIVRKEAANVLTEIYINQKPNTDFTNCMFSVMASAVLNDLHYEVQIAALKFWKNAIQNLMSNRGMIDGKFPSVTFSKEKRKIVILNESEIMKQLAGIMNELSSIGCLTVLHKCLNEECNVNVMEEAYYVTKDLVTILDDYKFERVPDDITTSVFPEPYNVEDMLQQYTDLSVGEMMDVTSAPATISNSELALREKVTESIVKTNDHDILIENYENYKQIKAEGDNINTVEDISLPLPAQTLVDPNRFLKMFKETDYLSIKEEKINWNSGPRNLDLLLDEILGLEETRRDIITECN